MPDTRSPGISFRVLGAMLLFVCLSSVLPNSTTLAATPYTPHQPNPILESWRWRQISSTREMFLTCMTEGPDGHLWFGSPDAVIRYDGLHWIIDSKEDGLDGHPIVAIDSSPEATLAATPHGIHRLDGLRWKRIFPPSGDQQWFFHDLARSSDGTVWASSVFGLIRVAPDQTTIYTIDRLAEQFGQKWPSVRFVTVPDSLVHERRVAYGSLGIQRSRNTILWVIPDSPADSAGVRIGDRILETQNAENITNLTLADNDGETRTVSIAGRSGEGPVRAFELGELCLTEDGALWASTVTRAGIVQLDPDDEGWVVHDVISGSQPGNRTRLLVDDAGSMWAITEDPAVGVATYRNGKWSHTRLSSFGGTDRSTAITSTPDGTIWIGGQEGVLHAWRQGQWKVYRAPRVPLPKTKMLDLVGSSEGALWILGDGRKPMRFDYATARWSTYRGLNFQEEDGNGRLWFLEQDGSVVSRAGDSWLHYGVSDGLIDTPTGITVDNEDGVWVIGSHKGSAAASHLSGTGWRLVEISDLSWSINGAAADVAPDGSLWVGAADDWDSSRGHRGGVARIQGDQIIRHTPPTTLSTVSTLTVTRTGAFWIGSDRGLHHHTGDGWSRVEEPRELQSGINALQVTKDGDLLVGHQTRGLYRYSGDNWSRYGVAHGLTDNTVWSVLETRDGSAWAMADRAISRYDGRSWTTPVLPPELPTSPRGSLKQSTDGALWISVASERWHRRGRSDAFAQGPGTILTIRYLPDDKPPETRISYAQAEVSQPGNTTITWHGADRWHETSEGVGVGVGLGLATAYRIVQKHKGRIDVSSDPGKGSTFTIHIPLT